MSEIKLTIEAQLSEHANVIRGLGKRVIADVIEIGRRLTEVKALVEHGGWLPWLEREFGWTDRTALNFMRVHELAKSENFSDVSVPVSALYMLAKPSMPPEARDEVLERLERGEKLTGAEVAEVEKRFSVRRPAEPPREMTATISKPATSPKTVDVTIGRSAPAPAPQLPTHTQNLRRIALELEEMLGDDLDEAAEYLIATKQINHFVFKKIGGALSYIGNTIQGNPVKTTAAATADKYFKKQKPH